MSPDNRTATMYLFDINNHFGAAGNHQQVEAWQRLQTAIDDWLAAPMIRPPASSGSERRRVRSTVTTRASTTHLQMILNSAQKGGFLISSTAT